MNAVKTATGRETEDEMEALRAAMRLERESIEFHKKLSKRIRTPKDRALLDRIVKEERQRFASLSNTYFLLSDPESWFMWEECSIMDGGTPWA